MAGGRQQVFHRDGLTDQNTDLRGKSKGVLTFTYLGSGADDMIMSG